MHKRPHAKRLIDNALEFLDRSISEIETAPKYSVINFCAAIELLLKARLMDEHWSLILKDPRAADRDKFVLGDFISVSTEDGIHRLERIAGETIPKAAKGSLEEVRKHRNHLIHFASPRHKGKPQKKVIAGIVAEQCKAWYYLHGLLTGPWKRTFKSHLKKLNDANRKMHGLRTFLKAKFDTLKPEIERDRAKGQMFIECAACGFHATEEKTELGPLHQATCRVCTTTERYIRVKCPDCKKQVTVTDPATGEGCSCGAIVDLDYLIDKYGAIRGGKDELISPSHAYCAFCEHGGERSVVPINGSWLCLNCLETYEKKDVGTCEWCNELIAGVSEDSYYAGCFLCDGAAGWHAGDDD